MAADFNGDGNLDVAIVQLDPSLTLDVELGQGNGFFRRGFQGVFSTSVLAPLIYGGNFNHDGILDLVVVSSYAQNVAVFLGKGDGTFEAEVASPIPFVPNTAAVGDFNGDGVSDVAIVGETEIMSLLSNGGGTFSENTTR